MTTSTVDANLSASTPNDKDDYFNPIYRGEGYLNRIRSHIPRKTKVRVWSTTCSFPKGKRKLPAGEKRDYNYVDVNATGQKALELLQKLEIIVKENPKATIWCSRIEIGDEWLDTYPDKNDPSKQIPIRKGRLLSLGSIWVNGELWYQDAPSTIGQLDANSPASADAAASPAPSSAPNDAEPVAQESVSGDSKHEVPLASVSAAPQRDDAYEAWLADVQQTLPLKITLRKADPLFADKIAALKSLQLYKWDRVEREEVLMFVLKAELKLAS